MHHRTNVRRHLSRIALLGCALALILPGAAHAASTYFDQSPGVGAVSNVALPLISVKVSDPAGISTGYQLKIDGVSRTPKVTWGPNKSYCMLSYQQTAPLSNSTHVVYASVFTGAGRTSTTWNFTTRVAPAIGPLSPADGSTTDSQRPTITAGVAPNGVSLTSVSLSVDGVPVSASYNTATKTVSYTPGTNLANDARHTATLSVTDATGTTASVSWAFDVQIYADMSDTAGCADCHLGYPNSHPMGNCLACHADSAPEPAYWNLEFAAPHDASYLAINDCTYCHSSVFPGVPMHGASAADAHVTTSNMSACPCHVRNLTTEHNRYTTESGGAITCVTCHASSDPAIVAGMASGSRACSACHTIAEDHPYGDVDHTADVGETADVSGKLCGECHAMDLATEHAKPTSSSAGAGCDACHPAPRNTFAAWDQTCSQEGCHAAGSPTGTHGGMSAAHAPGAQSCTAAGCHPVTDVAALHAAATTTTVESVTFTSCSICHTMLATPTKDCATCHPDRTQPHGYPAEDHVVTQTCVLTCHSATAGITDLKQLHDVASSTSFACTACHAVLVPGFSELYPAGWNDTCTACHTIADLHPAQATVHTGTDVAYQAASFFGNGCSDSTGHTGQSGCHTISNIAVVHARMDANGCPVCHGEGKIPSQECYTCHKPGYANTYTVPGTPSADITPYAYPTSDSAITAGWTYTTTPAGQPIYAVVNTPYPPASTTRFVTITSNTAGGVLFGYTPLSIPDNAVIRDVRIYAKARATNTTYPRKMQGVFQIGGSPYLSSIPSNNLTTVWTAGAGTGFATAPTRLDFTRQPLYGEMIWRNPKTGQDWTPAELNGTDPDSSLEGFGINLTASAAANNVSLTQIYLKVTYYTVGESVTNTTVGTHTYHGDNVKYLHDPSDVPAGQRFAVNPAHGWYDALYYQDCYDFCHRGNGGDPTFSASQGSWMWYSVGGDPTDAVVATRTLVLRPITVPSSAPVLAFDTNYQLGSGASGTVEISVDGGSTWVPLTGTVGGVNLSSLTGSASGWVPASYDLSAYAGQSAKLRFRYVNGTSTGAGWAFDSLSVSGASGAVFSDDAETLKPDWTNTYWTRSKGAFPYQ